MRGGNFIAKFVFICLMSIVGTLFAYHLVIADDPPIVSITISPAYPHSTDSISFVITATDDSGIDLSTFIFFIDEDNDADFKQQKCAANPCIIVKGPYAPGQIVNYYAIVKDNTGQPGISWPFQSFTVFDLTVDHSPQYPSSGSPVIFTANVAPGVHIKPNEFQIRIDENNDGFHEFSHVCSATPCTVNRPYSPGQIISYYSTVRDTPKENWASTLPPKKFTVFDLTGTHAPLFPKASEPVTFTAKVHTNVKIEELKILVDEIIDVPPAPKFFETQTTCLAIHTCAYTKLDADDDGIYYAPGQVISYYMFAKDKAGNVAFTTPTQQFTVGAADVPPKADFTFVINGLAVDVNDASTKGTYIITSWTWNFGDGTDLVFVENPGPHTYASAGTYTITLTVVDSFGLEDTESKTISVLPVGIPDVRSPYVIFLAPDEGSPRKPTPGFKVRYSAYDNVAVKDCKLSVKNGAGNWSPAIPSNGTTIDCGENKEITITNAHCSTEGTNTCGVRIWANDKVGHSSFNERFFTIDTTPPVVSISSNRGDPTQKTDVTFRFYASDPYGIALVRCGLDIPPTQDCNLLTRSYSGITPDGNHTFSVRATDKAGNSTEKSLTWEIDSTPPDVISSLIAYNPTYFSAKTSWFAPAEYDAIIKKKIPASQYDMRYSVAPINALSWNQTTAILLREHILVPPQEPGKLELMPVGPMNEADILGLTLGGLENLLTAHIDHHFAIRARDDIWNWSPLSNIFDVWTWRDPCDYDADQIYTPNSPGSSCGPRICNPAKKTCDLYDNPGNWHLPNESPDPYNWGAAPGGWPMHKHDDFWIRAFGATTKDIDDDAKPVADGRTGVEVDTGVPVQTHVSSGGTDWYDNPFTSDISPFNTKPNLAELSRTINDLDLDTFVVKEWKQKFGGEYKIDSDEMKTVDAELALLGGEDRGGCFYPDSREDRCTNCTAYVRDSVTGRIPPKKIIATTDKHRAVCQIEAYYSDIEKSDPPYEIIPALGAPKGTLDPSRKIISASAQCRDNMDNDIDGLMDSGDTDKNEPSCPKEFKLPASLEPVQSDAIAQANVITPVSRKSASIFPAVGLVQCGRYADDFRTPTDESANCDFCSIFQLINSLLNLLVSRLMPFLIVIAFVVGGILMIISKGNAAQFSQGKEAIRKALVGYVGVLLIWTIFSITFATIGIAKWTGVLPVSGEITTLTPYSITDSKKSWEKDEWKNYGVEIKAPDGQEITLKIERNDVNTLFTIGDQPFVMGAGETYTYHILNTGWWSFVCELGEGNPIADFSAAPGAGIAPFFSDFTDLSVGTIKKWQWDFGDGNTSIEQSPRHTYSVNGPHQVTLTIKSASDKTASITKTIHFAPTAQFTASETHGRAPFTVNFSNLSTGQIMNWSWDFNGDGIKDSGQPNPIFIYKEPGPYHVKLTVTGPGGRDSESKLNYIFVYPKPPVPSAAFTETHYVKDNTFFVAEFTNKSFKPSGLSTLDEITGWQWNFGDNFGTSEVEHPKYYFGKSTTPFTVTLTALGPGGVSAPATADLYFAPQAHFYADKVFYVLTAGGTAVQFHDQSLGTVNYWSWNFGDGTTDCCNNPNPSHTYTRNGRFTVSLTTRNQAGEENIQTITDYIVIAPRADFAFESVALSDPTLPVGGNDCLSPDGCTVGASGAEVTFSNSTLCPAAVCAWRWEFGDNKTSILKDPMNKYENNENFSVQLTATGPGGSNTIFKGEYIHIAPWAEFSAAPTLDIYAADTEIVFTNLSKVNIPDNGWLWNFGDTNSSIEKNPKHTYLHDARYIILLTATGPGGADIEKKEEYVIFPPISDFSLSTMLDAPSNRCYAEEESVSFTPKKILKDFGEIDNWSWQFGDTHLGTSVPGVTDGVISHAYIDDPPTLPSKNYTATSKANGPGGKHPADLHISTKNVKVCAIPVASFTKNDADGKITVGDTVTFTAVTSPDTTVGIIDSYSWSFPGATEIDAFVSNPPARTYNTAGTYNVTLSVKGPGGPIPPPGEIKSSVKTETNYITVCVLPSVSSVSATLVGKSATIVATISGNTEGGCTWAFGDGTSSGDCSSPKIHLYSATGTYTANVTATNCAGVSDSDSTSVTVALKKSFERYVEARRSEINLLSLLKPSLAAIRKTLGL